MIRVITGKLDQMSDQVCSIRVGTSDILTWNLALDFGWFPEDIGPRGAP